MGFEEALRYPKPGSRIAAAQEFGIDLTLVIENLRRTPDERVRRLQQSMISLDAIRQAIRRRHDQSGKDIDEALQTDWSEN